MPAVTCRRCGGMTNTAVADALDAPEGEADRCFVRWGVGEVPERGCAYGEADFYQKHAADHVLGLEEPENG